MDFLSTVKGSLLEDFFPANWDLKRMDEFNNVIASSKDNIEKYINDKI